MPARSSWTPIPSPCPSWRTGCAPRSAQSRLPGHRARRRRRAVPEGRGSAGSAAPPGTRPGRPGHRQAAIGAEANVMSFPESDSRARGAALAGLAAVAVALAAAAYLLWRWANDMSGVRREPPKVSAIIPLPPPPPPPPEPETAGARAAKEEQQPEPEPVPTPEPPAAGRGAASAGRRPRQPDADRWRRAGRQRRLQHRRRPGQGMSGGGGHAAATPRTASTSPTRCRRSCARTSAPAT